MGVDNNEILLTKQPDKEVDDRTRAVANKPGKEVDEERTRVSKKKRSKKVKCMWCCALAAVIFLLVAAIFIILIFTVFKVRGPIIKVTSLTLQSVSVHVSELVSRISAEVDTNMTVYNPNVVEFEYGNSTAQVFYRGEQVAEAPVAAGTIKAKSSKVLFLPVHISLESNNLINGNLTDDLAAQTLPLVSEVHVKGTVKFGLIKIHNIRILSECDITYHLDGTQSYDCNTYTKI